MLRNRIAGLLLAVIAVGCGDKDPIDPVGFNVLDLGPAQVTLTGIGVTHQLNVQVHDKTGAVVPNVPVTYGSTDTTRIRVTASGLVTAVRVGTADVSVSAGGMNGRVTFVVSQVPAAVEIAPATVALTAVGMTAQLTAVVRDPGNTVIPGAAVSWTSSDASKVEVTFAGMVIGRGVGSATITATSGGVSATRVVNVAVPVDPNAPAAMTVVGQGIARERYTSEIAALGNTVYSGSWSQRGINPGNAVKIWNVAGATPVVVDSLIIPSAGTTGDVQISDDGRLLVIANEYNPNGAITLFDLATPTRPTLISRFTTTEIGRGVHTVKLGRVNNRHYAFLSINPAAGSGARLVIVDITDPRTPSQVFHQVMGNPYVHDVFIRDGILFTALWDNGLTIWDVGGGGAGGSPSAPVELGNVRTVGGDVHNVHWFHDPRTGEKKYAFIGQESPGVGGGLGSPGNTAGDIHVVDVSNLRAPREVAFFHVDLAGVHNFAVDEPSGTLYAAYYNAGIRALDIRGDLSNCTAAQRAADGRCNLGLMGRERARGLTANGAVSIWGVALSGNFLYASDMLNGIWKLDIASLKR